MTQLENRLDKAIQRLNGRQAETRNLRDSIDGLRKERLALNEALGKLEGQLGGQRQEAARLLRISRAECKGRDKVSDFRCSIYLKCPTQFAMSLLPFKLRVIAAAAAPASTAVQRPCTMLLRNCNLCSVSDPESDHLISEVARSACIDVYCEDCCEHIGGMQMTHAGRGEHCSNQAGGGQGGSQRRGGVAPAAAAHPAGQEAAGALGLPLASHLHAPCLDTSSKAG